MTSTDKGSETVKRGWFDENKSLLGDLRFTRAEKIFLLVITVVCAGFLAYGFNGDAPICCENEEMFYAEPALRMVKQNSFDPLIYSNPASTLIYPLRAYYQILQSCLGTEAFDPVNEDTYTSLYKHMNLLLKIPRLLSVFSVLLCIPLLYLYGRRWLGPATAKIGLTVFVLCRLVIFYGQIVRPDVQAVFFVALTLFLIDVLIEHPTKKRLSFLIGIVTGLALSCRFFCLALVPPIATVYGVNLLKAKDNQTRFSILKCIWYFSGSWLTAFWLTSPFVLMNIYQFWEQIQFEKNSKFTYLTGLGPGGNLYYYFNEGMPYGIGRPFTYIFLLGFIMLCFDKRFKTRVYLLTVIVFFAGTCLNPRHWERWILPIMPMISMIVAYAFTWTYKFFAKKLIDFNFTRKFAKQTSFSVLLLVYLVAAFFPFRELVIEQYEKGKYSAAAVMFPFVQQHFPLGTKIAVSEGWDWPGFKDYNINENIWRPDYVPPRPHNFHLPEDIANQGYEYMVIQTWNKDFYLSEDGERRFPEENKFYKRLLEAAPVVFTSVPKEEPWILGKQILERCSPVEIYDLRPLASKKPS